MRPPTACLMCRNRRRRCIAGLPGEPCAFCRKRNAHCTLTLHPTSAPRGNGKPTPEESVSQAECVLPPRQVCEDLIGLYFQYIHDTTQWIFHKPSVLEDFALHRLPEGLLLGMVALVARFSNHTFFSAIDPRLRGLPYARKAAALLDLRHVSLENIQLCLMIGSFYSNEGEPLSEGIYYSTAARMATLLKLDKVTSTSAIEDEVIVRTLWTLKMSDVWSSIGNRVHRVLPPVPLRYPANEATFQSLRRGTPNDVFDPAIVSADPDGKLSMVANIIQLNGILERIANYITTAIDPDAFALTSDTVEDLAGQLDLWYQELDPLFKDTPENLKYHAQEGQAHVFLSMYLGTYHFGQLLHYQYLHSEAYNDNTISEPFARRCKEYAAALCDLLYRGYDTPGAEVYYSMVGHVLVIASTVQIHTVMFDSDETEIRAAKHRLERNYQILTELLCFWPTLDVSMARLREFHRACLKMKESTFRMDQWMRRFLFEFAIPIDERQPETADEKELGWPLFSPTLEFSPLSASDLFDDPLQASTVPSTSNFSDV